MTDLPHQPQSPAPGVKTKLPFELQSDEAVLLFARRHWLYFYSQLALIVLAGLVVTIAGILLVVATFGFDGWLGKATLLAIILWAGYWGVRAYFHWYRYNNDLWAVTNQRLVDSIKKHWFHHAMASADLVDVEDIRVVREGVLHTMFNFGDVRCQTAGEVPNFVLDGIPNPVGVLAVVDNARDAARRSLRGPV
jgi:hypothetical protein